MGSSQETARSGNGKINFYSGAGLLLFAVILAVVLGDDIEHRPVLVFVLLGLVFMAEMLMQIYTRPLAIRDYFDTNGGMLSLGATLVLLGWLGAATDEPVMVPLGGILVLSGLIVLLAIWRLRRDSSLEEEFAVEDS